MMLFGTGVAFFLGKPYIQPSAPRLPSIDLGGWSEVPQLKAALQINALFLLGIVVAVALGWMLKNTAWGLKVRVVGESADAARALGLPVDRIRILSTAQGGFLAGIGGSYLSLYYPFNWSEGLSSGQGLMAVALVIFARWQPMACLWVSLLWGGAAALGPSLQSVGITYGYYIFNAIPYIMTLAVMIITCSPRRTLVGVPHELTVTR
jgi:simple sugar transport system permease protein